MNYRISTEAGYSEMSAVSGIVSDGDSIFLEEGKYHVSNAEGDRLFADLMEGRTSPVDYRFWHDHPNVVFKVRGKKGVVFDGCGAELFFSGLIQPFSIEDCENVVIRNVSLDWTRPPYSSGTILSSGNGKIIVRPDEDCLLSGGEPVVSYQDFKAHGTAPAGNCIFEKIENVEKLTDGDIVLHGPESEKYLPGRKIIFRHIYSYAPVFRFYRCKNVRLENVTIHAGPGMGIIAHRCDGVTLSKVRVVPSVHRLMSVNCDATHFISCLGRIDISGCVFEGMGDDATNVHGFYLRVIEVLSAKTVRASLDVTTQDFEGEYPLEGEKIYFVGGDDLLPLNGRETYTVVGSTDEGGQVYRIELDGEIVGKVFAGDMIVNETLSARLTFSDCRVCNIRGRGVLIQSDEAEIKNCLFENCTGQCVHINTAAGWAESNGTRNVKITGNAFLNCGYGTTKYCDACGVVAGTECGRKAAGVHRNIVISGNRFSGSGRAMLIECCDGVSINGNSYEGCQDGMTVSFSRNISINDPTLPDLFVGEETEKIDIEGL